MSSRVLHFGGNGHASSRLAAARRALAERPGAPRLVDVPYPGFEGRPGAATREAFLDEVARFCRSERADAGYASGIGALIALGLRARGELAELPLIFQGPVLWGLEQRVFPKLMRRSATARSLLRSLFHNEIFRERFARKQFRKPLVGESRRQFFDGYDRCAAFVEFFEWFAPDWLRELERRFARAPAGLGGVTVWLGGHDRVVGAGEVEATEEALGVRWPRRVFPEWGHYPMIDEPEEWADALCHALAPRLG